MIKKSIYSFYTRTFQKSYYNHRGNFAYEIYKNKTSLSNYVCEIKKNLSTDPIIKWEIIKNVVNVINIINCAQRKN